MHNRSASKSARQRARRGLGTLLGATLLLSCADTGPHASTDEAALREAQVARSIRVRATGSGCPSSGAWEARVRDGGALIEVQFLRFSASLEPSDGEVSRSCALQIALASGEPVAYEPATLEVTGRASEATLSTGIWWASRPEVQRNVTSLLDSEFYENYDVEGLWSSCGARQELRVSLDARIPRGNFELDGATLTLRRRQCTPTAEDAGAQEPDAATSRPDAGPNGGIDAQVADGGDGADVDGSAGGLPVEIGTPSANGPGCGAFAIVSPVKPDGTGLTMRFSGLSGPRNAATSCNVVIPAGSATREVYAISHVSVKGSASLLSDMKGVVSLTPRIQGVGPIIEARELLSGPTAGSFAFTKTFDGSGLGFGPCGRARTLQLAISLGVADELEAAGRDGRVDLSELSIDFARKSCSN